MSKWDKFKDFCFDAWGYIFVWLLCTAMLVVPAATVVWGIKWILTTLGLLG